MQFELRNKIWGEEKNGGPPSSLEQPRQAFAYEEYGLSLVQREIEKYDC